jgi:hypothetical protein
VCCGHNSGKVSEIMRVCLSNRGAASLSEPRSGDRVGINSESGEPLNMHAFQIRLPVLCYS